MIPVSIFRCVYFGSCFVDRMLPILHHGDSSLVAGKCDQISVVVVVVSILSVENGDMRESISFSLGNRYR